MAVSGSSQACGICLLEVDLTGAESSESSEGFLVKDSIVYLICTECPSLFHLHCYTDCTFTDIENLLEVTFILPFSLYCCYIFFSEYYSTVYAIYQ